MTTRPTDSGVKSPVGRIPGKAKKLPTNIQTSTRKFIHTHTLVHTILVLGLIMKPSHRKRSSH